MDFTKFYINQSDKDVNVFKFKNNTTLKAYGCGVVSFSSVICQKLEIENREEQLQVVKNVIDKATNIDGNLVYSEILNVITNDKKFNCKTISEQEIQDNLKLSQAVVAHIVGHFVVISGIDPTKKGYEMYLIKDSGKRTNINLQQALNDYKTNTVKAYYILENI